MYHIQKLEQTNKDWQQMIGQKKEKYAIHLSDKEIQEMSKTKFKKLVNESLNKFAFSRLIQTALEQSKFCDIVRNVNIENMSLKNI